MNPSLEPEPELRNFLVAQGLARPDEPSRWRPLAGGVSSDIWRVDLPGRSLCIKRALAKLKVAADWSAPVSRNASEWAWIEFAARHCPDNAPCPLAHDPQAGLFAMSFLSPEDHPVWKAQLLAGDVSPETARKVGELIGRIHAASAKSPDLKAAFDTTDNFRALRLEPYFAATAERHPTIAGELLDLTESTASTRLALVHGDVSPKNILVGPRGPVLLDAECAWFGDPAFDLAFCLNHLLLKRIVVPHRRLELSAAFDALAQAFFQEVNWEARERVEERAARLLAALLLARIDGKSPVEYVTTEEQRNLVRGFAIPLVREPARRVSTVGAAWLAAASSP